MACNIRRGNGACSVLDNMEPLASSISWVGWEHANCTWKLYWPSTVFTSQTACLVWASSWRCLVCGTLAVFFESSWYLFNSQPVRLAVLIPKEMPPQKKYQRAEMMLKAAPEFFRANMRQRNRVAKALKCEVFANVDTHPKSRWERLSAQVIIKFWKCHVLKSFWLQGQLVNPLLCVPVWDQLRNVRQGPLPIGAWLCSGKTLVS